MEVPSMAHWVLYGSNPSTNNYKLKTKAEVHTTEFLPFLLLFFFDTGLKLCSPGWSQTYNISVSAILSTGITGVYKSVLKVCTQK